MIIVYSSLSVTSLSQLTFKYFLVFKLRHMYFVITVLGITPVEKFTISLINDLVKEYVVRYVFFVCYEVNRLAHFYHFMLKFKENSR